MTEKSGGRTWKKADVTAYDYLAEPFVALLAESDALCAEMAEAEDMEAVGERYQACLDRIDILDAYNYDSNIRRCWQAPA